MVTKQQLRNLARGRAIRQRNLQMQRRAPQRRAIRPLQRRIITIPRNAQLFGQFVNPDIDVTRTDHFNQSSQDMSQMPNMSTELNEIERDRKKIVSGQDVEGSENFIGRENFYPMGFRDIASDEIVNLLRKRGVRFK